MLPIVMLLNVVAIICALYITWRAYQDSFKWGLFFFFTPVVYYGLARFTGPLIAGAIVIGLQLYYVVNHWNVVGKAYVIMVLSWGVAQFLPTLIVSQVA